MTENCKWYYDLTNGGKTDTWTFVDNEVDAIRERLEDQFDANWLETPGDDPHPLQKLWTTKSAHSRVYLAHVDYIIQALQFLNDIDERVSSLAQPNQFYPTLYELRVASLFAANRQHGWDVQVEPYGKGQEPDVLLIAPDSQQLYISCKYLRAARAERDFRENAPLVEQTILEMAKDRDKPMFDLEVHFEGELTEVTDELYNSIAECLNRFQGQNRVTESHNGLEIVLRPPWSMAQLYSDGFDHVNHAYQVRFHGKVPQQEYRRTKRKLIDAFEQLEANASGAQPTAIFMNVSSFLRMRSLEDDLEELIQRSTILSTLGITRWSLFNDADNIYRPFDEIYLFDNPQAVVPLAQLLHNNQMEIGTLSNNNLMSQENLQRQLRFDEPEYTYWNFDVTFTMTDPERRYYFGVPTSAELAYLTKQQNDWTPSEVHLVAGAGAHSMVRVIKSS